MKKFFSLVFLILTIGFYSQAQVVTDEIQEPFDSSPGSPPLETDDPGTPGPLGVEVNFLGNCDYTKSGRNCGLGLDMNIGFGDKAQLRVQRQTIDETERDESHFYGYNQTSTGFKYRFYETNTWKFAVYPSYQFDDESRISNGRSLYLPLIVAKQFGSNTFIANIGPTTNFDYSHEKTFFTSLAIGHSFAEDFRVMGEITSENKNEGRTSIVRAGVVKEFPGKESDWFETAVFGSLGQSIGQTEDRQDHFLVLIGFTLAKKAH